MFFLAALALLALALAAQQLAGQAQVGDRAAAAAVVADDALAMAGRFGQAHVARHDGAEDLVAEVVGEFGRDRVGQVVAHVEHGAQHAFDFQPRVEPRLERRSEEHTSELQSLMRNSYAVFCLTKKNNYTKKTK